MPNPTRAQLEAIADDRRRQFRGGWFARLLSGALSVSDTFWLGNLGPALVMVPLGVIGVMLLELAAPGAVAGFLRAVIALVGLYQLALARALWLALRRTKAKGGARVWGWVGLLLTMVLVITLGSLLISIQAVPVAQLGDTALPDMAERAKASAP